MKMKMGLLDSLLRDKAVWDGNRTKKHTRTIARATQHLAATNAGSEHARGWHEGHQRGYSEGWYAAWAEINRQRAAATPAVAAVEAAGEPS